MTVISHHTVFDIRTPWKIGAMTRYVRAAKYAGIAVGIVLASPVLLVWVCYGAVVTAREINRSMG